MRAIDGLEWFYYLLYRKRDPRDALRRLLACLPDHAPILDFGGGDGRVAALRDDAFWVVADVDPQALRAVRKGPSVAAVRVAPQPPYPFPDRAYPVILLVDVLHHLSRPVESLVALSRAMAGDARLILVEYDGRRWITRLFQMLVRWDGRRCTPRTPAMVRQVMESAGFLVEDHRLDRLRRLYVARTNPSATGPEKTDR